MSTAYGLEFLEHLDDEIRRRQNTRFAALAKYQQDPIGFIERELYGFLWSKQKQIAASVLLNRRTAVKSCHDVGKSFIASRIAAWWCSVWEPGEAFCVTLAPTYHQVKAILWRELKKAHSMGNLPGDMNVTEWKVSGELIAFGRSPADNDATAIQGIHASRVLVIGDEACGLSKDVLDGADSLIANDDSRILLIGNPDDPSSEFANTCRPGSGWNVIRINAFESPNLTGEYVPDKIRPLLVSKTWVEEKRISWGEGSPLWISKITGDFPDQASDALVPISAIEAAVQRWKDTEAAVAASVPDPTEPHDLGVDCARFGDDTSVIMRRRGWRAKCEHRHKKRDLMTLVGEIIRCCKEDKPKRIKVDDTGMGGGVTDRLREIQHSLPSADEALNAARVALADVEIIAINVGEAPVTQTNDERFKNFRAQVNWELRMLFVAPDAKIAVSPNDDLLTQATQIKYKVESTGEIMIEKKADMKKRTKGRSPDDWDALVLAFCEPNVSSANALEYYRRLAEGSGIKVTLPSTMAGAIAMATGKAPAMSLIPKAEPGRVRLVVKPLDNGDPPSTVYGMSGTAYMVSGGQIEVVPDDVQSMLERGYTRLS